VQKNTGVNEPERFATVSAPKWHASSSSKPRQRAALASHAALSDGVTRAAARSPRSRAELPPGASSVRARNAPRAPHVWTDPSRVVPQRTGERAQASNRERARDAPGQKEGHPGQKVEPRAALEALASGADRFCPTRTTRHGVTIVAWDVAASTPQRCSEPVNLSRGREGLFDGLPVPRGHQRFRRTPRAVRDALRRTPPTQNRGS
jgi:hypothetical protein